MMSFIIAIIYSNCAVLGVKQISFVAHYDFSDFVSAVLFYKLIPILETIPL